MIKVCSFKNLKKVFVIVMYGKKQFWKKERDIVIVIFNHLELFLELLVEIMVVDL